MINKTKIAISLFLMLGISLASSIDNNQFIDALKNLSKNDIAVKYDNKRNPIFIKGRFAFPKSFSKEQVSKSFLNQSLKAKGTSSTLSDFDIKKTIIDKLKSNTIIRLKQKFNNVPVFNNDIQVVINNQNEVILLNGSQLNTEIDTNPQITVEEAISIANTDLQKYTTPVTKKLEIYVKNGFPLLTWHLLFISQNPAYEWHYFIDAKKGKIASKYNNLKNGLQRKTYDGNNLSSLPGTLILENNQTGSDSIANSTHANLKIAYDYFKNTHNRDGYDGNGTTIKATVHHKYNYLNAYWSTHYQQMVYGDGDGYLVSALGADTDVVVHEFGHAVTEYTADLIYEGQSGALNESMSDLWAIMVDRADWMLGEDSWTPNTSGDALRYVDDPTLGDQPAHMDDYNNTSSDNGGVHSNSGIPNKAFYNAIQLIGHDDVEDIYYRALTTYFTSSTGFLDARYALIQSAEDLFGAGSTQANAISSAFDEVGITLNTSSQPGGGIYHFENYSYSTPHPYSNSQTYNHTISHPGATAIKISFTNFNTESNYDKVRLKDGSGNTIYTYDGNLGDFISDSISGDTVIINFYTDSLVTDYGFDINGYYYRTIATSNPTTINPVARIKETGLEYSSIQDALFAVNPEQTIYIVTTNIPVTGNFNLTWPNVENITLMPDPSIGKVELKAQNGSRHIFIIGMKNITLKNLIFSQYAGDITIYQGGMIYLDRDTDSSLISNKSINIENCIISGNKASYGSIIYIDESSSNSQSCSINITSSTLNHNISDYGGIYSTIGKTKINFINSNIHDNYANYEGGFLRNSAGVIKNCVFEKNTSTYGAIFFCTSYEIENCIFKNNSTNTSSRNYGGLDYYSDLFAVNSIFINNQTKTSLFFYGTILLLNCLVANNVSDVFYESYNSSSLNFYALNSIIIDDTLGASAMYFARCALPENTQDSNHITEFPITGFTIANLVDAANGDYQLKPENNPAIDSGLHALWDDQGLKLTEFDIAGQPRKQGFSIDLGPYEYQPSALLAADLAITTAKAGPNPFDPKKESTHIGFTLSKAGEVKIYIHAINGDLIFSDTKMGSTNYDEFVWDGKDKNGEYVGNGGYYAYLLVKENNKTTKKLIKLAVVKGMQ